jgi:hypothetical protein
LMNTVANNTASAGVFSLGGVVGVAVISNA